MTPPVELGPNVLIFWRAPLSPSPALGLSLAPDIRASARDWAKRAAVALRLGLVASASSTSASSCGESKSASQAVGAVLKLWLVQAVGRSMVGASLRSGEVAQAVNSRAVAARLAHFKAVTPEWASLLLSVGVCRLNIISVESRPQQRWLIH